jgi:hypothetical protein
MAADTAVLLIYAAIGAGWFGYGLGYREAKHHYGPHARVGRWVWKAVESVRDTRMFVGDMEVKNTAGMVTPDGKRFKVTVEQE